MLWPCHFQLFWETLSVRKTTWSSPITSNFSKKYFAFAHFVSLLIVSSARQKVPFKFQPPQPTSCFHCIAGWPFYWINVAVMRWVLYMHYTEWILYRMQRKMSYKKKMENKRMLRSFFCACKCAGDSSRDWSWKNSKRYGLLYISSLQSIHSKKRKYF